MKGGSSTLAKYAYFVALFELSIVAMFTYLYVDNTDLLDKQCTKTPIVDWWIVSLTFAYFGGVFTFFTALVKEFLDYWKRKQQQFHIDVELYVIY